ncbi:MAG TPA: S8 family serine peptidase [Solirubrobacterales bacterium]|nr:S8 family serine peptidase [Solirubrobacterales bacterium]
MQSAKRGFLFWAVLVAAMVTMSVPVSAAPTDTHRYAVVFERDEVANPGELARSHVSKRDGRLLFVYRHALEGYAAVLTEAQAEALKDDPRVDFVARDRRVEAFGQTIPTGVDRVFASANSSLDVDGVDDVRVNADVAVIDTGIASHSDLNVAGRTNCLNGTIEEPVCVDGSGSDGHGHGTHVAGTVGALDNGTGVVGVAPGVRLWGVRVLNNEGGSWDTVIAAGADWVTATRTDADPSNDVEVANMSLGADFPLPLTAAAITGSVARGVVYVVAAGNESSNAANSAPANHPDVITVSAIADTDGDSGAQGSPNCWDSFDHLERTVSDDSLAPFSNRGTTIEIAAPGVCIKSTLPGGGYGTMSGTSMASPHVAGAGAILAAKSQPKTKVDVEAIRKALREEGNLDWTDTSSDGVKEPLLDVGNDATVATKTPFIPNPTEAKLRGSINPGGVETKYHFEYGTTTSYGTKVPLSAESVGSGTSYVKVTKTVSGLQSGTEYHFRIVATNSKGTFQSPDRVFTTSLPSATTRKATRVNAVSAELNASIAANGYDTRYYFQWGTKAPIFGITVYDHRTPIREMGPSGNLEVTEVLKGLQPETKHYFRVVAVNEVGTTIAQGLSFTTSALTEVEVRRFGDLCLSPGCPTEGSGTFQSWLETPSTPPSRCEHEFEMHFVGDGAVRMSDHEFSDAGLLDCAMAPCASPDAEWQGQIVAYDKGIATARLNACLKWVIGNSSVIKKGVLEVEIKKLGKLVEDDFQVWAYPQDFGGADFEAKWSTSSSVEIAAAPTALTQAPVVNRLEATLKGIVNPNGLASTYWIEYGPTTSYGTSIPASPGSAGDETEDLAVQQTIGGLEPEATYHYRVVASNEIGTTYGEDETFTVPSLRTDADVSGDGRADLVTVDTEGKIHTFKGTDSGIAASESVDTAPSGFDPALLDDSGHYLVDVADVSGDGRSDLVTMKNSGGAAVFKGTSAGGFEAPAVESLSSLNPKLDGSGIFEPIAAADVNGDGRADLVGHGGFGLLATYLGQPDGSFGSVVLAGSRDSALLDASGDYFLDVADVTGDGLADLISMNTNGTTYVSKGQSDGKLGTAEAAATINPIMDDGSGHEPVGVGDVNLDGRADLVTLDGTTLKLWAGQAAGTFAAATNPYAGAVNSDLTDGTGEELVGLLDHNRDGRADLVSLNSEGDAKTYTAQSGSPATFASPTTHAGSIDTVRGGVTPGHEPASEKPFYRRAGCTGSGCDW